MSWEYTAIMSVAIAAGFAISRFTHASLPLSRVQRVAIAAGAFCGGIIAAKLPFVLSDWSGFLDGSAWFEDGKTITFGLAGGYFGVELTKWALGVRTKTGDAFALPVAVSIGIGRLACFTAGCCHGIESTLPWAVDFGDGVLRHPAQIYELGFHVAAALALLGLLRRGAFRGQLIKLYIVAYFCYRFLTEFIRPEPELALGMTLYQWAALVFVPVFTMLWIVDARALRRVSMAPVSGGEEGFDVTTKKTGSKPVSVRP